MLLLGSSNQITVFYPFSECAPSTSFHIQLTNEEVSHMDGFIRTGFECHRGADKDSFISPKFYNCSLCTAGFYNKHGFCLVCHAGN